MHRGNPCEDVTVRNGTLFAVPLNRMKKSLKFMLNIEIKRKAIKN